MNPYQKSFPSNKPENRLCAAIVLRSALMLSTSFIVLDLGILQSSSLSLSPLHILFCLRAYYFLSACVLIYKQTVLQP